MTSCPVRIASKSNFFQSAPNAQGESVLIHVSPSARDQCATMECVWGQAGSGRAVCTTVVAARRAVTAGLMETSSVAVVVVERIAICVVASQTA